MKPKRFYWDANSFLAFLKEEEGRVENCRQILHAAERGDIQIVTSALTLTEVVHIKGRIRMDAKDEELISGMFEKDFVIMDVDRRIAEHARQLLWQHQELQPKDSIHVASALVAKVDELHTFDDPLLKLDGKLGTPALKICKPGLSEPELPKMSDSPKRPIQIS